MINLKELLIHRMLRSYGFGDNEFSIKQNGDVVFKNFDTEVMEKELNKEGAPMPNQPGRNQNYYHNYVYPEGLFPGYEQMRVTKHADVANVGRIDTITLPLSSLMNNLDETQRAADATTCMNDFVATINLTSRYDGNTAHTVQITNDNPPQVIFTANYKKSDGRPIGEGATPGEELLDGIILGMVPRVPNKSDIGGPNTISALGRIAPFIMDPAKTQLKNRLLNPQQPHNDTFLHLRDTVISGPTQKTSAQPKTLTICAADMQIKLNRECREGQFLVSILENVFKVNENNSWISVDNDFFKMLASQRSPNAQKFRTAIKQQDNSNPPALFITTTSGGHAFGIKVDFKSKTLFVANASGDANPPGEILESVKQATGCPNVVSVVTQPIARDEELPTQDTCTADALAMTHMLMTTPLPLTVGCLNTSVLQTGSYLRQGLGQDDRQVASDKARSSITCDEFAKAIDALLDDAINETQTAEAAWVTACGMLRELKGSDSPQQEKMVRYSATHMDAGDHEVTIEKDVPERIQIALDRLYAEKLSREWSPSFRG